MNVSRAQLRRLQENLTANTEPARSKRERKPHEPTRCPGCGKVLVVGGCFSTMGLQHPSETAKRVMLSCVCGWTGAGVERASNWIVYQISLIE